MATKATKQDLERSRAATQDDFDTLVPMVGYALRHLDDRTILNRSPLARRAFVQRLAEEKYKGQINPRGKALGDLLFTCVDQVLSQLKDEHGLSRACQYLQLLTKGFSCHQIGEKMGLSREHISRVYRRKALELVAEQFLSTINGRR